MKRLLAAIAAICLLAGSASAKGLVIVASTKNNNANFANGIRPLENIVVSTLRGLGADFDVIRGDQLVGNPAFNAQVDSYLRHGKVWRNFMGAVSSSGDSLVTTYNPVIHVGFSTSDANYTTTGTSNSAYKPDSLTLARYYPTVAQLFIGNPNHTANVMNTVASRCSTGLISGTASVDYYAHTEHDSTLNAYEIGNPGRTWKSRVGFLVNATRSPKGWRPIIGLVGTRHKSPGEVSNNYDSPCNSCAYSTNPDTVGGLWSILNVDATGAPLGGNAKPMIFASLTHISNASDFDMGTLLTAIALADSVSGGGLLSSSAVLPAKIGIHIDDGWKRGDSNGGSGGGGIAPTDTTALKASIDSLAALGVPFVVGVEVDSIASAFTDTMATAYNVSDNNGGGNSVTLTTATFAGTFPSSITPGMVLSNHITQSVTVVANNGATLTMSAPLGINNATLTFYDPAKVKNAKFLDGAWWARAPLAHFTPHCHSGVGSPGAGFVPRTQNVGTKFLNIIDQWGIVRPRFAFGSVDSLLAYGLTDYVNDVADSAASYWLTKRAFAILDSAFGKSRVDHLAMPPGDDWTNRQVRHSISSTNALDSIIVAATLAGATGLRSNAYSTFSAVVQSPVGVGGVTDSTNHYGYYINQQQFTVGASGSPAWVPISVYGSPCNILSCFGYPNTTANAQAVVASVRSWSRNILGTTGNYRNTLRGLFGGPADESTWTGSATSGQNIRASIHALHVGDLGSRQPAVGGELTRPGYYNLKYLVNSVRVANAHARQPLIVFAYPEDIQP